jgi:hypothetical protein
MLLTLRHTLTDMVPFLRTLRSQCMPLALFVLLCTGCLTIEENYTFKRNGSGTLEYVVDISSMMRMLESFGGEEGNLLGEGGGMGAMDMQDEAERLKTVPGISRVKLNKKKAHVQRLSFRFKDVAALNEALNVLKPDTTGERTEFFAWDGNTLVRRNNRHAASLGDELSGDTEESEAAMEILRQMLYKYTFRFASPIASTEVADGVNVQRKGNREVLVHTDWAVLGNTPEALDLRIALEK